MGLPFNPNLPTKQPAEGPDIEWTAAWGDQVKVGDLIKVTKLGGPVRIVRMRRFNHNHSGPRPVLVGPEDDGHWYYGAVVVNQSGMEFHLNIQPFEPVFIGLDLPKETAVAEGNAPDGELGPTNPDH